MGLFDKKYCSVCGEKIGFLGNRKLEDGNLCKECAKKLSPFFSERRQSTVEDIKKQLAYREDNKAAVTAFHVTRTMGGNTKVLLDEDNGRFLVCPEHNWQEANPDVLDFSQVTGCDVDIKENRHEIMNRKSDGTEESFNPPRYEYDYDFFITIHVNAPYFDEIRFRLNDSSIDRMGGAYQEMQQKADEIKEELTKVRQAVRQEVRDANTVTICSHCGASTAPDEKGCCPYCGSPMR